MGRMAHMLTPELRFFRNTRERGPDGADEPLMLEYATALRSYVITPYLVLINDVCVCDYFDPSQIPLESRLKSVCFLF